MRFSDGERGSVHCHKREVCACRRSPTLTYSMFYVIVRRRDRFGHYELHDGLLDFPTYDALRTFINGKGVRLMSESALLSRIGVETTTSKAGPYTIFMKTPVVPYPPAVRTYGQRYASPDDDWMHRACLARAGIRCIIYNAMSVDYSGILQTDVSFWITNASVSYEQTAQFVMDCVEQFYRAKIGDDYRRDAFNLFATPLRDRRLYVWETHQHVCDSCDELREWESKVDGDDEQREYLKLAHEAERICNLKRLREAESELADYDCETSKLESTLTDRKKARVEIEQRLIEWRGHNV